MAGIEHMGVSLAAKRFAPMVPLWVFFIASEVLDLLCIPAFLTGLERMGSAYYTHSMVMALVWSVLCGLAALGIFKTRAAGVMIGLTVFSHWVVDFITHPMSFIMKEDVTGLPFFFGFPNSLGLGLYRTLPGVITGFVLFILPPVVIYIMYRQGVKKASVKA